MSGFGYKRMIRARPEVRMVLRVIERSEAPATADEITHILGGRLTPSEVSSALSIISSRKMVKTAKGTRSKNGCTVYGPPYPGIMLSVDQYAQVGEM